MDVRRQNSLELIAPTMWTIQVTGKTKHALKIENDRMDNHQFIISYWLPILKCLK
ncbi:hypothetical protein PPM_1629 [Paenibacillus polymyxa M1]|nr:hypothetical protein PPM_1629 [Paenibacillus polymyxa M1]